MLQGKCNYKAWIDFEAWGAKMERQLYKAAAEGDVNSLLDLLKEDPLILDRCTVWSLKETPLHIAAMLGHEKFVDEVLDRKPELAGEMDSQKLSSLHLSAAKGYLGIVKKLLSVNAGLCYARDKYGMNPLHVSAVKGRVNVLKELVRESPDAARHTSEHGETILHLCVKHNNLEALKLLVEIVGDHEFVNAKNDDGDTILHLAAADKQTETINFLMSCTTVEANSLNQNGVTAYELLAQSERPGRHMDNISNSREARATNANVEALSRNDIEPVTMEVVSSYANYQRISLPAQPKGSKKNLNKLYDWLDKKRNALMVVASLTAAIAFQVGVNPPGGFWQDTTKGDGLANPHTAGSPIMADNYPIMYVIFLEVSTVGFLASLSIILLLMSGLPLRRRFFVWILMAIIWTAITSTALTYLLSIAACAPHHGIQIHEIIALGLYALSGLIALLLTGHAIRLILKTIRSVRKLLARRSSVSTIKHQDSV